MKITSWLTLLCLLLSTEAISQKINWDAESYSFFDNTEFGNSKIQIPQTMAGTRLAPELSLGWDSIHRLNTGINLLHEFGSDKTFNNIYLTAYYEFDRKPFRFIMGAFPRISILEKYPRIFFQDSVAYYRPNLNGFFWEVFKIGRAHV
jgi:hypothetical protein